jgi:AcrR family transcriptional regulator
MTNGENPSARERIIAAAKQELHEVGVLGLRVQEVARKADTSVALMYKYFVDRDGLLAEVLGDMHDERINYWEKMFTHALSDSTPRGEFTVEDLLLKLPTPNSIHFQSLGMDRAQTLAALSNNPKLRARIEQTTQRLFALTLKVVANADANTNPHSSNLRVISLVISSLNLIFINNELLGEQRITDDEYRSFIRAYFISMKK